MPDQYTRLLELGLEPDRSVPVATEVVRLDRRRFQAKTSYAAMGTLVSVTAIGRSGELLDDAIAAARGEMERLIAIFSRFETASALTQLNGAGQLRDAPPELASVVQRALAYHAQTRGAFDITVAPLVDLYRERLTGADPVEPTDAEIREARGLVAASAVSAGSREVRLGRAGMRLTLDGIAKGFIVDRMAAALEAGGVRDFLIDGGGDISTRGRNAAGRAWTVAVQDPEGTGRFPDVIPLANGAVATSGSYERHYDAGRRFHHIVDGATGRSPLTCSSVSVVARSAMLADVLATSVFVLGPDAGLAFIEGRSDCSCLIIDQHGRAIRSRRWTSIAPPQPDFPE